MPFMQRSEPTEAWETHEHYALNGASSGSTVCDLEQSQSLEQVEFHSLHSGRSRSSPMIPWESNQLTYIAKVLRRQP